MSVSVLAGLQPEKVFANFEKICSIPHGSYHVEMLSNYLMKWAKEHELYVEQDEAYNILIRKPASAGMEEAPVIILQGHMDMVCEKNQDVSHDFLTQGLKLICEGDDIKAEGTTLGGDDGIAVAYAMAVLEDDSIVHPALEVLITTEEEVGMEGAIAFDVSHLKGKYLINLDSEEEGVVLTSCAGGATLVAEYPLHYQRFEGVGYVLEVRGLLGGHSGADIHLNRANANILMIQFLKRLQEAGVTFGVSSLSGGNKTNAIPRESSLTMVIDDSKEKELKSVFAQFECAVLEAYKDTETSLCVNLKKLGFLNCDVLDVKFMNEFVESLAEIPDGVYAMSSDIENLVETSSNLGIIKKDDSLTCEFLLRSSKEAELDQLIKVMSETLKRAYTIDVTISDRYPGWEYRADSKLRKLVVDVYEKQYHKPMRVEAIHAGLECGIFASRKQLDIVSIGPDILDIHTPKETLKIASTRRTYELLLEILARASELA